MEILSKHDWAGCLADGTARAGRCDIQLGKRAEGGQRIFGSGGRAAWLRVLIGVLAAAAGMLTGSLALAADGARGALQSAARLSGQHRSASVRRPQTAQGNGGQLTTAVLIGTLLPVIALVIGFEAMLSAIRTAAAGTYGVAHWAAVLVVPIAWAIRAVGAPAGPERAYDAFLSAVALTGTGAAWYGSYAGIPLLEPIDEAAGCAIGIAAAVQGCRMVIARWIEPEHAAVARSEIREMEEAVRRVEGVIAVESLRAWEQGHYVAVSLSVLVNPYITMQEGQEIGRRVKEKLLHAFGHVMDVQVRVDPYDSGFPYKTNVDPRQERVPTLLQ